MKAAFPPSPALDRARRQAVRRGLAYLGRVACHPRRLSRFGSGLLYCCAFMASTAADPWVRRRAEALARRGWTAWRQLWGPRPRPASADEVAELVHGHLAADRLGICPRGRRAWLARHASRFGAIDFLGWDPVHEPPPADLRERCGCGWPNAPHAARCANPDCRSPLPRQSRHRAFCLALTATYCGERLGVRLGRGYADVLRWLPTLPDYPPPSRGAAAFHDAVYTVTHLVYTLNDYGRFRLDPAWLPREYAFLARNLEKALARDDPDMVGEFLDTLRAFGVGDDHPAIRYAMECLLACQNSDGSWGPTESGHDYHRFHTTWAVLDGLRDFQWPSYGLSFPELLPRLRRWAKRVA